MGDWRRAAVYEHRIDRVARRDKRLCKPRDLAFDPLALVAQALPGRSAEQTQAFTDWREPAVGIIFAQEQAVLRPRGKHPVWLAADSARHQVVNHHSDVRLVTPQNQRWLVANLKRGVDSRHQALSASFLVAGSAIDLAGEEEPVHQLGLPGRG